jgi:hypothetical protein
MFFIYITKSATHKAKKIARVDTLFAGFAAGTLIRGADGV